MADEKISEMTEDTSPDFAADFVPSLDMTDTSNKKFKMKNMVNTASAFTALTDGANIAVDWDTAAANFSLTLGGNRTLDNPTNGKPGTWRTIVVTQDGTGSRTLAYGNQYKFPGGTEPVLTTAAASVDVLSILCVTSTNFFVFSALDMKV